MSVAYRPGHPKPKADRQNGPNLERCKLAYDDSVPFTLTETRAAREDVRFEVGNGGQNDDGDSKLEHCAEVHQPDRIEC